MDITFSPTFIVLVVILWILAIAVVFFCIWIDRSPDGKGKFGEILVGYFLKKLGPEYKIMNNVMLRNNDKTAQIDHTVVSPYGVFVIETKSYSGTVYGKQKANEWTQYLGGRKRYFMNPIHQNYGHIKALQSIIGDDVPVYSIITFSGFGKLKTEKGETPVVYFVELPDEIKKHKERVIGNERCGRIVSIIRDANISSIKASRSHVDEIRRTEEKTASGICPRCGSPLVTRNGKRGEFIGCSAYPKCRFTKSQKKSKNYVPKTPEPVTAKAEEKTASGICPRCGSPLVTRNGKRGEFIGCSDYPKCRFTKNI